MVDINAARELFERALNVESAYRSTFVTNEARDEELAAFVLRLLAQHEATPATVSDAATSPSPRVSAGGMIGSYRIEAVLGQGGMGIVYLARQSRPDRQVALKVIRPGLVSAQLLRRFEYEAELLGRLSHAGIAQIYEAGTADLGSGSQPYFAMERVEGLPLTLYAKQNQLGLKQKLELIALACDAVEHAHQRGIVHRDLKPSNILVTAAGQPKILDFGVARATDGDMQTMTLQTDIGQLVGTISYMSPEQVSGDPRNIDTRSDVFALGVILFELLTGRLPFPLENRMIHEAVRIIREEEPTHLSSIDRALRGDVETIAMHALERDKQRRYQSAAALAADIRRHLGDEPITARPASTWYQVTKFSRRNRVLVGAAAAVFLVLILGIAGTSFALRRAIDAEAGLRQNIATLEQITRFQEEMLENTDPQLTGITIRKRLLSDLQASGQRAGLSEQEITKQVSDFDLFLAGIDLTGLAVSTLQAAVLEPAADAAFERFEDQPILQASLLQSIANTSRSIGIYELANRCQEKALELRRTVLGELHPDTLKSTISMSALRSGQGNLSEAEFYGVEASEKTRHVLGPEHPIALAAINNLGLLLRDQARLEEAEPICREAVEVSRRVLGPDHPDTAVAMGNLGLVLQSSGQLVEAESQFRTALEIAQRVLDENHPTAMKATNNLGFLLWGQGRFEEAEALFRESLASFRRTLGERHPKTLMATNNLGVVLCEQRKFVEAEPYLWEGLTMSREICGNSHPETLNLVANFGILLRSQGRLADAEPFYQDALEQRRRVLGEDHPDTLLSLNNLGSLLRARGMLAEAESCFRDALDRRRRTLGQNHPDTLVSVNDLGHVLQSGGRHQEVIDLLAPAEPAARMTFTSGYAPRLAAFLRSLGRARLGTGYDPTRYATAASNLNEAYSIYLNERGPAHKDTVECAQTLVDLYTAWNQAEPDNGYDAKAEEWRAKLPQAGP